MTLKKSKHTHSGHTEVQRHDLFGQCGTEKPQILLGLDTMPVHEDWYGTLAGTVASELLGRFQAMG